MLRGVAVAGVVALAAWLAVRAHVDARVAEALTGTTGEAPPWLSLCVAHRDVDAGVLERRESSATGRVLFAVARTLAPEDRRALTAALEEASELWEARANPLVDVVSDGAPDAALRTWLASAPGAVGVARAAARDIACGGDGLCVRVVAKDPSREAACPAPYAAPVEARVRARARFLLWPWGYALTFRAKDAEAATRAAEKLRVAARKNAADARIGLVLASDDTRAEEEGTTALAAAVERHAAARAAAKAREAPDWEAAAHALADAKRARVPDVLASVRPDEVVVMPFLDGAGRLEEVATAVEHVAPELERVR